MAEWLGTGYGLRESFAFISSRAGEDAMKRCHVRPVHKEFLLHFARLILQEDYPY